MCSRAPMETSNTILDAVRNSYLATDMTEDELATLTALATLKTFQQGETVVRQFDREADLYIVLKGKVVINASNGDLVARIKAGGLFGEISLLDDRPRSATVVAESDVELVMFPAPTLRESLDANPSIAAKVYRNLSRTLCDRLRSANVQIEALLLASGMDF